VHWIALEPKLGLQADVEQLLRVARQVADGGAAGKTTLVVSNAEIAAELALRLSEAGPPLSSITLAAPLKDMEPDGTAAASSSPSATLREDTGVCDGEDITVEQAARLVAYKVLMPSVGLLASQDCGADRLVLSATTAALKMKVAYTPRIMVWPVDSAEAFALAAKDASRFADKRSKPAAPAAEPAAESAPAAGSAGGMVEEGVILEAARRPAAEGRLEGGERVG
jgi:hypothetical protein